MRTHTAWVLWDLPVKSASFPRRTSLEKPPWVASMTAPCPLPEWIAMRSEMRYTSYALKVPCLSRCDPRTCCRFCLLRCRRYYLPLHAQSTLYCSDIWCASSDPWWTLLSDCSRLMAIEGRSCHFHSTLSGGDKKVFNELFSLSCARLTFLSRYTRVLQENGGREGKIFEKNPLLPISSFNRSLSLPLNFYSSLIM